VIVNRIMGIEVEERRCLASARWRRRKLASTGAVHARKWDAGSGKPCAYSRLRRIVADSEYRCLRRRTKHVCEYVDCIELATGTAKRLTAEQCRFGYRDSIFKHEYQDRYAIVAVGLRLSKTGSPY
jgi:UDP-N-acetylmuramate dehydrogenase